MDSNGVQRDIGISNVPPPALRRLSATQRTCLALLKIHDALFKAYEVEEYNYFFGGNTLTPQDYNGITGLAVMANYKQQVTQAEVVNLNNALE